MTDLTKDLCTLGGQLLETLSSTFPEEVAQSEGEAFGWVRPVHGPGVAVGCDGPLACALASAMFRQDVTAVDSAEVIATLSELANIMAGNARGLLGMEGPLGSPSAATGPLRAQVSAEACVSTPAGDLRVLVLSE